MCWKIFSGNLKFGIWQPNKGTVRPKARVMRQHLVQWQSGGCSFHVKLLYSFWAYQNPYCPEWMTYKPRIKLVTTCAMAAHQILPVRTVSQP